MHLNEKKANLMAQAILNTFELSEFRIDKKLALADLKKELIADWEGLNSEHVKTKRHGFFKVLKSKPSDFSERLLQLSGARLLICGIRHKGLNPELPFVNCIPGFKLESKKEALEVFKEVRDYFKVFDPKYICFWKKQKSDCDLLGSVYMLGEAATIMSKNHLNEESLHLEKVTTESYFPWYQKIYEDFHKDSPNLKWKVSTNDKEVMNESLGQGLLYFANVDEQRVGLIAAVRSEFLGHRGIYFNEIAIEKNWKGKGLAKILQKKFVSEISDSDEFIWGTIDGHNIPSYKTALANGRRPVRYECFFDVGRREA